MIKSHQREIRERKEREEEAGGQTSYLIAPERVEIREAEIKRIDYRTAATIILEYEWIGTMPLPKSCRYIYGIYFEGVLGGVEVYVEPTTRQYNEKYPRKVVQLNRGACAHWTPKNTASRLIGKSVRELEREEGIKAVVAYCTKEAGEVGTIYQACNFMYVGETKPSKAYWLDNHWVSERTLADKIAWAKGRGEAWKKKFEELKVRELEGKYKYVLLLGSKKEKEQFMKAYGLEALPYPKR